MTEILVCKASTTSYWLVCWRDVIRVWESNQSEIQTSRPGCTEGVIIRRVGGMQRVIIMDSIVVQYLQWEPKNLANDSSNNTVEDAMRFIRLYCVARVQES